MTVPANHPKQRLARWCRLTCVCVAVLFSFGMTRFYLVIPLDKFICLDVPPAKSSAAPVSATHTHEHGHDHDHGPVAATTATSEDGGFIITHCKDEVNGIALTPIQPLGAIVLASFTAPPTLWAGTVSPASPLVDSFVSAPFQPPRA